MLREIKQRRPTGSDVSLSTPLVSNKLDLAEPWSRLRSVEYYIRPECQVSCAINLTEISGMALNSSDLSGLD